MTTTIEINNLRMRARHGVLMQERSVGNDFTVTVHLRYPVDAALVNDEVSDTLNYAEAVEIIKDEMSEPSALLEHVAARIRHSLMDKFPKIEGGFVRIAKLKPPIPAQMENVAVKIEW
ncbi:MAG: dihydroneopterin aldolase [Muribaculaceae bacterium]|nr:dihydroneopterin aldolase [Muribaculaceae bacterium]MDE6321531.1 dihydroneopterin aldolase [Muribaculaceae bacterium]